MLKHLFVEIHMNSNYSGFQQYLGKIILFLPDMISLSGQLNDTFSAECYTSFQGEQYYFAGGYIQWQISLMGSRVF